MIQTVRPLDAVLNSFIQKAVLSKAETYRARGKRISDIMLPAGITEENFRAYLSGHPFDNLDFVDKDKIFVMVELASCETTASAEEIFGSEQARQFFAIKFIQLIKTAAAPFFIQPDVMEEVILYSMAVAQDVSEKFPFSGKAALNALLKDVYLASSPASEAEKYTTDVKESIEYQFRNLRTLVTESRLYDFWSDILPTDACRKIMISGIRSGLIDINREYPGYSREKLAECFSGAGTPLPDEILEQLSVPDPNEDPFA